MKLMICGKGGSGKSTLSVLLARTFTRLGRRVLLVDADESNLGLHRLAGADNTQTLLEFLGGREALQKKPSFTSSDSSCALFFQKHFRLSDIPDGCLSEAGGVRLLKIGKTQRFEEGCACPVGGMMRQFLAHIRLDGSERVIIDAATELEHFGRGIEKDCDRIIDVIDPNFESFKLAKAMEQIAVDAGLNIAFVLNKADERVKAAMGDYLAPDRIIGEIPMSDAFFTSSLEGTPLDHCLPEIDGLCRRLDIETERLATAEPGP